MTSASGSTGAGGEASVLQRMGKSEGLNGIGRICHTCLRAQGFGVEADLGL